MNNEIEIRHDQEFKGCFKPLKQEDYPLKIVADLGMRETGTKGKRTRFVLVECPVCKKVFETKPTAVKRGDATKCRRCACKTAGRTHGESKTRLYSTWKAIKNRCHNPNSSDYPQYGARGVSVCDEWRDSYEAFRDWALANGYSDELTIDRIDNNGNYTPDNCRWTTHTVQSRNTRRLSDKHYWL